MRGLGAEPLAPEFDAARLATLFAGSRAPLKVGSARPEAHRGARATSMCARLCFAPVSRRRSRRASSPTRAAARPGPRQRSPRRSAPCSRKPSKPGARLCAIIGRPTANSAISSTSSRSTIAKARPACGTGCRGIDHEDHPGRALDLLLLEMPALGCVLRKGPRSLTRRSAAPISPRIPFSLRENGRFLPFSRFLLLSPSSAPPSLVFGRAEKRNARFSGADRKGRKCSARLNSTP